MTDSPLRDAPSLGTASDADFELAARAVSRGWVTREQVEGALRASEAAGDAELLRRLALTDEQVRELRTAPEGRVPPEVAEAMRDPARRRGRYWVVRDLKSGGMGKVCLAWDSVLPRFVALKLPRYAGDPGAATNFLREAQLAATLDHPHIAKIYEVGEEAGAPFIAMQFIDGLSFLDAERQRPREEMVRCLRDAAAAVAFAHERGIIHRDLKPANLMLDHAGHAYVLDFGLAKETSVEATAASLAGSTMVSGTPQYMPPEQARGKACAQSDVWGLGATLYEIVTGRPPFTGESVSDVLMQVLTGDLVWPRKLSPKTPRDLEAIILRCLERDLRRRYPTAAALVEDLDAYLARGPLRHARRPTLGYVVAARIRRQPLVWGMGAAAVLAVVGGTVVALVSLAERARVEREEREKTEAERRIAEERLGEIRRLADVKLLADYTADADALWPAAPGRVPELEAWLGKARVLAARLPLHRQHLAALRVQARAAPAGGRGRAGFVFADAESQWEHDTLTELVAGLEQLAAAGTAGAAAPVLEGKRTSIASVEQRLAFARGIRERSTAGAAAEAWRRACASIADRGGCPAYGGLALAPQVGLVPLGRDPLSGLWEFADLQTGDPPVRRPDGGLELRPETGIVFVLLPGGRFRMGAVPPGAPAAGTGVGAVAGEGNVDPKAQRDQGPVHEVALDPFFVSKYEMTQAQWLRFAGTNPSQYAPPRVVGGKVVTPLHPVESVSWDDCADVFARLGFLLPTEAQWEYATRAGTTTPFWTGTAEESLAGAVNVADRYAQGHDGAPGLNYQLWLDDGYTGHGPVGSYRANAFGLHDMAGNVWEWCRDAYGPYTAPCRPGDGERTVAGAASRVLRGGGFRGNADECRSAFRGHDSPGSRLVGLGVRPMRAVAR